VIYCNYVSLLRKAELHVVAHFNIQDLMEGGNENYSELSSNKYSLHLNRSAACV